MGTIIAWALRLGGPVVAAATPFLPAWASVKGALKIAAAILLLTLGALASWTVYSWGEPARLARASAKAVELDNLRDRVKAQTEASRAAKQTLEQRAKALEASEAYNKQLEGEKEALRAQTEDPAGADTLADDPWLRAKYERDRRRGVVRRP